MPFITQGPKGEQAPSGARKTNIKYILIVVILAAIVGGGIFYIFSDKLKASKIESIKGKSDTISQFPAPGKVTTIIMDFSKCSRGSDLVYLQLGSTYFAFEGIKNDRCVYYYGTEIEMSKIFWYKCSVLTNLGQKSFNVSSFGIEMQELDQYCSEF